MSTARRASRPFSSRRKPEHVEFPVANLEDVNKIGSNLHCVMKSFQTLLGHALLLDIPGLHLVKAQGPGLEGYICQRFSRQSFPACDMYSALTSRLSSNRSFKYACDWASSKCHESIEPAWYQYTR